MKFDTTKEYLDFYIKKQTFIEVVFHAHNRMSWGRNRKNYDGNMDCPFNHRQILIDEVVFDFDDESAEVNAETAEIVSAKLRSHGIKFSVWHTGGKGIHIHTLWNNLWRLNNTSLIKKRILKFFAFGRKVDYQLAGSHLVRAEWGLYEKNYPRFEKYKTLIADCGGLEYNDILPEIFESYKNDLSNEIVRSLDKTGGELDDKEKVKKLMDGDIKIRDGRERVLFYLIHQLKKIYEFDDVVKKLQSWYYYNGGSKLTPGQIRYKVKYQWKRNYSFGSTYLDDFIK